MKSTRLTIYLLKDVNDPAEAIASDKKPNSIHLDPTSGIVGIFYFDSRPALTPSWVSFVGPLLSSDAPSLTSSSTSGLLVIRIEGRYFALTFGYGRGLLDMSKIEHRFGLRVALNLLDPSKIRSLDTKTFEDMVVTKNTQVSKSSDLPSFGIDVSRDILRAVTGELRDKSIAKKLSGADALVANVEIEPSGLSAFCSNLLHAFEDESYKNDFGWIDNLALVRDSPTIEYLNELVTKQLKAGDTSLTHMAMPETIGWEDVDAFKIGGTSNFEYEDLDLDEYLVQLDSKRDEITLNKLKSRFVSVRFSRTGDWDRRWNLYQCLISEQRYAEQLHVLIEGRWFVVSESLVEDVDGFVSTLPPSSHTLIDSLKGETEPKYNRRLSESPESEFLLLDALTKKPEGATSGIELCDVLALNGEFLHVKRKSRSSTLSHLFAQGIVSATTFLGDGKFRDEIRQVIVDGYQDDKRARWLDLVPKSDEEVIRSKYSVSFVVIANSNQSGNNWLPFFSKLNLMQCGRQIRNLGFNVCLNRVSVSER